MNEAMPPPCTRLLFGRTHDDGVVYAAKVDEMTHCSNGGPSGLVRQFNLPKIRGFETTVWAELPAADDPRWRIYDRTRNEGFPRWEQEVLCFAKVWNNPNCRQPDWTPEQRTQYVSAPVGEAPHFPGFAGSPHQRDWGVLKWMPLVDALRDAKAIPAEFLKKISPFKHWQNERKTLVEQESENIFLTVINTGHCYHNLFKPICKMGPQWISRNKDIDPKAGITRLQGGFAYAVQGAISYLVGKKELERDMNIWHDACNVARFKIAEYYYNHAKELTHG